MNLTTIQIQAHHDSHPDHFTHGKISVSEYSDAERTKRALKTLAMIWGGAIACVLIPMLHFVLVPSGLLAGPIAAYWRYGIKSEIKEGAIPCPKCGKEVMIEKQRLQWPMNEMCTACQSDFKLESRT